MFKDTLKEHCFMPLSVTVCTPVCLAACKCCNIVNTRLKHLLSVSSLILEIYHMYFITVCTLTMCIRARDLRPRSSADCRGNWGQAQCRNITGTRRCFLPHSSISSNTTHGPWETWEALNEWRLFLLSFLSACFSSFLFLSFLLLLPSLSFFPPPFCQKLYAKESHSLHWCCQQSKCENSPWAVA